MGDKIISLSEKREEKDHTQLLLDLQEFIEAKVEAGEPIVVIIEKNISFWERVKEKFNLRRV